MHHSPFLCSGLNWKNSDAQTVCELRILPNMSPLVHRESVFTRLCLIWSVVILKFWRDWEPALCFMRPLFKQQGSHLVSPLSNKDMHRWWDGVNMQERPFLNFKLPSPDVKNHHVSNQRGWKPHLQSGTEAKLCLRRRLLNVRLTETQTHTSGNPPPEAHSNKYKQQQQWRSGANTCAKDLYSYCPRGIVWLLNCW